MSSYAEDLKDSSDMTGELLAVASLLLFMVLNCCSSNIKESNGVPLNLWRGSLEGADYILQLPTVAQQPKGVLFVAHGCSHSSTDWWIMSPSCPSCIGLPVEVNIVQESLRRNYAVLAVSSLNRRHKCWTIEDVYSVSSIINKVYHDKLRSNYNIPLFLLGASSGGSFVGVLSSSKLLQPRASAMCVHISSVREYTTVPVLFLLMQRDEHTLEHVRSLAGQGQYRTHKILVCTPKPITSDYFFQHAAVHTMEESTALQKALLLGGYLYPSSLLLREDPRGSDWRRVIAPILPAVHSSSGGRSDGLVADASALSEALNLAWAAHEITDEYLHETFEWFEANSLAAFPLLAQ